MTQFNAPAASPWDDRSVGRTGETRTLTRWGFVMHLGTTIGLKTASELASQHQVHPVQISTWKKQALEAVPETFKRGRDKSPPSEEALTAPLYEEIGRLKTELDW